MSTDDQRIEMTKGELTQILRDLEMVVESLKRIQACCPSDADRARYERMLREFMDQWEVYRRLEQARDRIARSLYIGATAAREEFERDMEDVSYWYVGAR